MKRVGKLFILIALIFLLFMVYRGASVLVDMGKSSEEILVESEDVVGKRVYSSKVVSSSRIPYCTLKRAEILYDKENEDSKYKKSKDIFKKIADKEPENKSLALVHKLDFNNDKKLQYLLNPLEVVSYCNNYTIIYKYGKDDIDCIAIDYSDVPLDSFCTELITVGYKERVLVNLNNYILEDGVLYTKGYKYSFEGVQDALASLYFDEEDTKLRSVSFIESYLSLPYTPFRNVSIYLVSEDDMYYDFGVLYNDTEEMMVKTLKGGKPYLIYADNFPKDIESYLDYTDMFIKYKGTGGDVVWRTVY